MVLRLFRFPRPRSIVALRRYYAIERPPPARASRLGSKPVVSLDQFILRSQVIGLYRTILRSSRHVGHPDTVAEVREFARKEFEINRSVEDPERIRFLLSKGRADFKTMEGGLLSTGSW